MLHGDITYMDEALYENKLSVVFDDLPAARETLDRVRDFVREHPTVYCGTHTPQGYENLETKRVMNENAAGLFRRHALLPREGVEALF